MDLKNKIVILTGASGGLGRAFAKMLADEGASVIAVGRNESALQALIAELPAQHRYVVADIATTDGRNRVVDVAERLGASVLINNAGISELALLDEQDPAQLEAIMQTNLLAPMLLTQAVLPLLKTHDEAAIVNIGSTFGSIGFPGFSAYCASKFGLRGFTEALRRELADSPVAVRYLAPRATQTDINTAAVVGMNAALGNAMDAPETVAEALRALMVNDESHRYVGWPEKLFVRINGLFPFLVDGSLRKQLQVIRTWARAN